MNTAVANSPKTQSDTLASEPVLLRRDEGAICTLTLNRPAQYNALSEELLDALENAFKELAADNAIRVVILAAAGKVFCGGHDLKEMRANPNREYYEALFKKCSRVMMAMIRLPQPVIARVHGVATAAGCQLVASADMAVASEDAGFGTSGINVGLFCMTPGVALSRNVNRKRSFEMLFTGEIMPAPYALEAGLVNKVTPLGQLDAAIGDYAQAIIAKSQAAITAGKRVFYRQLEESMEAAYTYASEEMARNMMFHDAGEGIDAFIAKRKPKWKHE